MLQSANTFFFATFAFPNTRDSQLASQNATIQHEPVYDVDNSARLMNILIARNQDLLDEAYPFGYLVI